jgi:aminoglycoside phosphotransferase (APT) family kinase protein
VRVIRSAYATSASVFNVHLECAGGERLRAVYKRIGAGARIAEARGIRPAFLQRDDREPRVYRSVLAAGGPADVPALLAAGRDAAGPWLLLEWAGSVDLSQVGDRRVWCEAARRLARFHTWGESRIDRVSGCSPVRWDDPGLHFRFARRARANVADASLTPLWRRYAEVAGRLSELPSTIVHGDFNASNLLVSRRPGAPPRLRFIDWESAGVGSGLLDLAALVSGGWSDAERSSLVAAYRSALETGAAAHLPDPAFDEALAWCRLALAVQWLAWAPAWSPPPRQAHDWRGEASRLARELGLLSRAA